MHVMLMDYSGEIYAMFTMYQEEGNYNDCIMGSNSTFIVKTKFTNLRRKKKQKKQTKKCTAECSYKLYTHNTTNVQCQFLLAQLLFLTLLFHFYIVRDQKRSIKPSNFVFLTALLL